MLAIESDIHLAVFPTIASCLIDHQFIPNDVYNGLEAIAECIDAWRVNLVTRIKQYASTINDLQSILQILLSILAILMLDHLLIFLLG